jgi:hypothetical protein
MATNYNTEMTQAIIKAGKLSTAIESIPNQISKDIQLTCDVNPNFNKRIDIVKYTTASNANLAPYTTPANQDFYLTGFILGNCKNVTSDNATITMSAYKDGKNIGLAYLPGITLTAQNQNIVVNYTYPMKLDRNTAITVNDTAHTVGVSFTTVVLYGFVEEVN